MTEELVLVRAISHPDGTHPDGDTVSLLPSLSLDGGIVAIQDFAASGGDTAALTRRWLQTFVRYGAVGWTLHDPEGEVWDFDVERLLADFALAWTVADKADDLYGESVLRPLGLTAQSRTSPPGPTDASTPPTGRSTSKRRARSSAPPSAGQPSPVPTA